MENDSTTVEDNQSGTTDSTATENQTTTTTGGDNLESTTSTTTQTDGSSAAGSDAGDSASKPKFDADLDDWAAKTNRAKPETDRERELYQEIRDGQRDYSRSQQAKQNGDAITKAISDNKPTDQGATDDDDDDPLAKRLQELEKSNYEERSLRQRSEFFSTNQISKEQSDMMGEILKEKVAKGGQTAFDYWTNPDNLEDWYQLAKARLTDIDTSAVADEAARKERERIAKESNATSSRRGATNTTTQETKGYDRNSYFKNN